MKKTIELIFNLAYWLCYSLSGLMIYGILTFRNGTPNIPIITNAILAIIILPSLISFYGMYFITFPKFFSQQKWKSGISTTIIILFIAIFIGALTMTLRVKPMIMFEGTSLDVFLKFFMILVVAFINTIMAWVIVGFITWFKESKLKNELLLKNKEMEMALLKSKFDPHFLFNSLNNIDALILSNPQKGSEFINKLSEIIRFMLYETQESRIPVEKEISFLKNYIELQNIRTSNKEYVELTIIGDTGKKQIAPNLFIPFVENAFKHCSNKKEKGAIKIDLKVESHSITFSCSNKYELSQIKNSTAMGNELIRKRLAVLYSKNQKLNITSNNGTYKVTLVIHE